MAPVLLVFLIFALIFGLYLYYLSREAPQKSKRTAARSVDLALVRSKWLEVQEMLRQGGPANFRQAIVESDKLVDMVLKSRVRGETMGERMREAKSLFLPDVYHNLWTAHKIRNKVVHEAEFEGLSSDAKTAVRYFEQALRALRVL